MWLSIHSAPWLKHFLHDPPARVMVTEKEGTVSGRWAHCTVWPESSQVDLLIDLEPLQYGPPTGPGRLPYPPLPVTPGPPSFAAPEPTLEPVPVLHYASGTKGQPSTASAFWLWQTPFCPWNQWGPQRRTAIILQYWMFSTSDFYNWRSRNSFFFFFFFWQLERLISLLVSVLFMFFFYQPSWNDCQQFLQVISTTKEIEKILMEARKLVLRIDGCPIQNHDMISIGLTLTRIQWDFNGTLT